MNLSCIIDNINEVLMSKLKLANIKSFGLTEFYHEGDKFFPGIQKQGGEMKNVFLQDEYNISFYHRSESGNFEEAERNFKRDSDKTREIIPVNLIIFADRNKTKLSQQNVKDLFVAALPSFLDKSICESIGIFDCRLELSNYELDTTKVFRQECNNNAGVRVGIEKGLLAIRYNLSITYRRGCTVICD
jgi:hypothetical protein